MYDIVEDNPSKGMRKRNSKAGSVAQERGKVSISQREL
jgi:hypothetical protein